MFTFEMRLPDGSSADPPTFVTSIPTWSVGDPVIVGAEVRYHILGIAYDNPAMSRHGRSSLSLQDTRRQRRDDVGSARAA
jgi:hypothetical protein